MTEWHLRQLTHGSDAGQFHAHSYYDVPIFSPDGCLVAGHRVSFSGRHPEADDAIAIGYVDLADNGGFCEIGKSRSWSWQQGALSQWLPGSGRRLIWNDREGNDFVARVVDLDHGRTETLERPVYAVDPRGHFFLSLNMARLETLRPGYGYAGGNGARLDERQPVDDGIWRYDFETGDSRLILSVRDAVPVLMSYFGPRGKLRQRWQRYHYWFNHVKLSPDGKRFTVKLRFRKNEPNSVWNDEMGVSLTGSVDGGDVRLLARGTSHVMWMDDEHLFLWKPGGVRIYRDDAPGGEEVGRIGLSHFKQNVHMQRLAGPRLQYVFDTPYREDIELNVLDVDGDEVIKLAVFNRHRPPTGPFRCDLHPYPSSDGRKIVVTSLQDGGRQIYLLERTD
ncbi:MAG: hypothetical protein WA906_05420 [Pacificimonas sp.]